MQQLGRSFRAHKHYAIQSKHPHLHRTEYRVPDCIICANDLILPTTVEIGGVFTFPEYRKQGFVAELVNDLACRIRQMNKTPLLQVDIENTPALAMYQKMNWIELGRLARVWLTSAA